MMFPKHPSHEEQVASRQVLDLLLESLDCCEVLTHERTLNALRELSRRNFVVECQQPPFRSTPFIVEQDANGCWLKPRLQGTIRPFAADCGANVLLDPDEFPELPPGAQPPQPDSYPFRGIRAR